jgi:predicted naringenin-chalcone synthase
MSSYLSNFKTLIPPYKLPQGSATEWLCWMHLSAEKINPDSKMSSADLEGLDKVLHRYAVKPNLISSRYSECEDFQLTDPAKMRVYAIAPTQPRGGDLAVRTAFYAEKTAPIFSQFYSDEIYSDDQRKPDHIIHVTCTGYISPSAAQKKVSETDWGKVTAITHAYHMGCYAAFPSIRMAQGFLAKEAPTQSGFQVDIVHTELCSLHIDPLAHQAEQIVVQSLFADGHVKYTMTSARPNKKAFRLLDIQEQIIPQTDQDMSWSPQSWGMGMHLSREVPEKIKMHIQDFLALLLKKSSLSASNLSKYIFAIHPGGPKIIEAIQEVFQLSNEQVAASRKVLIERGNMSSATLGHIWNEILDTPESDAKHVISFAFGPGLTIFGAVFEVCL